MGINNDEINHGVFHGSNQKFALLTGESTVIQWRELEEAYYWDCLKDCVNLQTDVR